MIDAVAAFQVEVIDRDELDTDVVQASVRGPAPIDIENPTFPALGSMGQLRGEIATVFCPAFFHEICLYISSAGASARRAGHSHI